MSSTAPKGTFGAAAHRVAILGLAVGLWLIAAAAPAAAQAPLEPGLVIRADAARSSLAVEVHSVAGARCRLQVSDEPWTRSFRRVRMGGAGIHTWHFAAPEGLNTAPWTFLASCSLGRQRGWRRFVGEMGFPSYGGALVEGVAPGSAPETSCDAQGICFAEDPFTPGECGWYGLGRRPDILPWVRRSRHAGDLLAELEGHLPEGTKPRVGALAIWSIGVDPPDGHVGYVADVAGSQVLIDDSNWRPTPQSPGLQVHEHWVAASSPTGYIYLP